LSRKLNSIEDRIKKLVKLLLTINIYYAKDSRLLQKDEFVRIPRNRFFIPDRDMKKDLVARKKFKYIEKDEF